MNNLKLPYHDGIVVGASKTNADGVGLPPGRDKKLALVPHPSNVVSNRGILGYVIVTWRNRHVHDVRHLESVKNN